MKNDVTTEVAWMEGYSIYGTEHTFLDTKDWGKFDPKAGCVIAVKHKCLCVNLLDREFNTYARTMMPNLNIMFDNEADWLCVAPCEVDKELAKAAVNYFKFHNRDAKREVNF